MQLHPNISILFENRDTVLYQIRELIFSEDLKNEDEIREYIDIYSPMLPLDGELSATLFIELDNQVLLAEMLRRVKGIEHHLRLEAENEHVAAVFEEEHDDRDFTTSVHYLKFPLTPRAIELLSLGDLRRASVRLVLDHPNLQASVTLDADALASLKEDLTNP